MAAFLGEPGGNPPPASLVLEQRQELRDATRAASLNQPATAPAEVLPVESPDALGDCSYAELEFGLDRALAQPQQADAKVAMVAPTSLSSPRQKPRYRLKGGRTLFTAGRKTSRGR